MRLSQGQACDLLSADHVQLVDTPLAHLALEIVLQSLGSFRVSVRLVEAVPTGQSDGIVLAQGELLHDFFELLIKVGGQVAIDHGLHLLVRPLTKQQLLVKHSDLVVDLRNVFKLICVDTLCRSLTEAIVLRV